MKLPHEGDREAIAELRVIATKALADCCDECRALLRDQLRHEAWGEL